MKVIILIQWDQLQKKWANTSICLHFKNQKQTFYIHVEKCLLYSTMLIYIYIISLWNETKCLLTWKAIAKIVSIICFFDFCCLSF